MRAQLGKGEHSQLLWHSRSLPQCTTETVTWMSPSLWPCKYAEHMPGALSSKRLAIMPVEQLSLAYALYYFFLEVFFSWQTLCYIYTAGWKWHVTMIDHCLFVCLSYLGNFNVYLRWRTISPFLLQTQRLKTGKRKKGALSHMAHWWQSQNMNLSFPVFFLRILH